MQSHGETVLQHPKTPAALGGSLRLILTLQLSPWRLITVPLCSCSSHLDPAPVNSGNVHFFVCAPNAPRASSLVNPFLILPPRFSPNPSSSPSQKLIIMSRNIKLKRKPLPSSPLKPSSPVSDPLPSSSPPKVQPVDSIRRSSEDCPICKAMLVNRNGSLARHIKRHAKLAKIEVQTLFLSSPPFSNF